MAEGAMECEGYMYCVARQYDWSLSARRAPPTTKPTSCSRMVKRGSGSSRSQRSRFSSAAVAGLTYLDTDGAGMCRKEKCAVSTPPSADCAQLHCCRRLLT